MGVHALNVPWSELWQALAITLQSTRDGRAGDNKSVKAETVNGAALFKR